MIETAKELNSLVQLFAVQFAAIPYDQFSYRSSPEKWSNQEVVGHLIDSAHNNLRRFITGQYSPGEKIIYDQDFWNYTNRYPDMKQGDLITLWVLMNKQIVTVLITMPADKYGNEVDTGKGEVVMHTLEWLAGDYVLHMKHHINQIIPGSFQVNYP